VDDSDKPVVGLRWLRSRFIRHCPERRNAGNRAITRTRPHRRDTEAFSLVRSELARCMSSMGGTERLVLRSPQRKPLRRLAEKPKCETPRLTLAREPRGRQVAGSKVEYTQQESNTSPKTLEKRGVDVPTDAKSDVRADAGELLTLWPMLSAGQRAEVLALARRLAEGCARELGQMGTIPSE
jgi:hypothetical protein